MTENYPAWTCKECALTYGGRYPQNHISSWHMGTCDVCKLEKAVTQPRDFCYPKYPMERRDADKQKGSQ